MFEYQVDIVTWTLQCVGQKSFLPSSCCIGTKIVNKKSKTKTKIIHRSKTLYLILFRIMNSSVIPSRTSPSLFRGSTAVMMSIQKKIEENFQKSLLLAVLPRNRLVPSKVKDSFTDNITNRVIEKLRS